MTMKLVLIKIAKKNKEKKANNNFTNKKYTLINKFKHLIYLNTANNSIFEFLNLKCISELNEIIIIYQIITLLI